MASKGPFNVWVREDGTWELRPAQVGGGTSIVAPSVPPFALVPRKEIVVTGDAIVPAWNGDLYVAASNGGQRSALNLPALAATRAGNRIFVYRTPEEIATGLASIDLVVASPTDQMNGYPGGRLTLEGHRHAVWLERSPSGWIATWGDNVPTADRGLADDEIGTMPPWGGLKIWTVTGTGPFTAFLPPASSVGVGTRGIFLRDRGVGRHRIQVSEGDTLDGITDGGLQLTLRGKPVELVRGGTGWYSLSEPLQADEVTVVTAGTATLTEGWYGMRCFSLDDDTTLVLPASTDLIPGSTYACITAASNVTIDGNGSNITWNGFTTPTISPNELIPVLLVWSGLGWYVVGA